MKSNSWSQKSSAYGDCDHDYQDQNEYSAYGVDADRGSPYRDKVGDSKAEHKQLRVSNMDSNILHRSQIQRMHSNDLPVRKKYGLRQYMLGEEKNNESL